MFGFVYTEQAGQDQRGCDLFLCLAYLPPQGSVFWERGASETDVFMELESEIAEARSKGEVLLAGDLNAWIGEERDWVETEGDIEGVGELLGEVFAGGVEDGEKVGGLDGQFKGKGVVAIAEGVRIECVERENGGRRSWKLHKHPQSRNERHRFVCGDATSSQES